jgi:hypothetical protein
VNYPRGINRAFFVFCIVWVFFVLVGVPVVVWNQFLQSILSRERQAIAQAASSVNAESKKYWDEDVKVQAQEYDKWRSFPYFYKELWGNEGAVILFGSLTEKSSGSSAEKSSLPPWPLWLTLILFMSIILPMSILPMSILEAPGWLVMPFLMFLPPGVVWIMLATLRWIIRGFRGFPAHTS